MFQEPKIQPLLAEESYTLHGKEAQHFFGDKVYTAARRGDKFCELVQDVFENVRSTICVGWDAQQKATHHLPMSIVLAAQFKRENEWCMRGIADDAYAEGVQDCLQEIVSRSYIARRKQIEAQRKRTKQTEREK